MMKTIIVDDDEQMCMMFKTKLQKRYRDVLQVIGTAFSAAQAISMIDEKEPALVFLDHDLGDGTAFSVLDMIDADPVVVLLTGSPDHGIEAVNRGVQYYLQKPLNNKELDEAIQSVLALPADKHMIDPFVVLRTGEGIHRIHHSEIIYCQSAGNYSTFHLKNGKNILISKPSKFAGGLLQHGVFFRVSQSIIVNSLEIRLYDKDGYLHLSNGSKVRPSTSYRSKLKELLS